MSDEKKIEYYHIDKRRLAVQPSSFDDFSLNDILRDVVKKLISAGREKTITILLPDKPYKPYNLYAHYFPEDDKPDTIQFEVNFSQHISDQAKYTAYIYHIDIDSPLTKIDDFGHILQFNNFF